MNTKPEIRKEKLSAATLRSDAVDEQLILSAFSTTLGWIGLLGDGQRVSSIIVGHASAKSLRTAAARDKSVLLEDDWAPAVREQFQAYAEGEVVDFSDVEISLPPLTVFQQKIITVTRQVGYGLVSSYGQLASRAGHPRAARAVGTVMSTNRFPILIPCHRVLASGGKIGGYTSASGIGFKQRLLDLEARASGRLL